MWADIVYPNPRTMKLLAGEREREREKGWKMGGREKEGDREKEIEMDRVNN